jgi:hypothetical protein
MISERLRTPRRLTVLLGVVQLVLAFGASASVIPSKEADPAAVRQDDLARVGALLEREEVAMVLAARGLAPDEVELRLAQLSDQDLHSLASNVDQIQAAGSTPTYIWVLLAILMAVVILAIIF